jgi:hypothetical protein
MERKPAVAVVFHHIGPYHHARLNAAADRFSVTGIEWSGKAYDAWGAATTPARYHKVSLFPEATAQYPGNAKLKQAFWEALERTKPDVVAVNGWNNFGSSDEWLICSLPHSSAASGTSSIWWNLECRANASSSDTT